jgi:cytochrome P450
MTNLDLPVPSDTIPSYELPEATRESTLDLLRQVQAETRVGWFPALHAYVVARHADIVATLRDPRLATANMTRGFDRLSPAEQTELLPVRQSIELWMGHTNPADHLRFQRLLKRYFTPATVNGLRPRVRAITNELLDAVSARGRMDVVADLAYPLPANIIAEMLGMPVVDRPLLRAWSRDIRAVFQMADADRLRASQHSILEMQDYLRVLVDDRRTRPTDDLLTLLVEAERAGKVTEDEIVSNCVLLLFAGHETTAGLIANGLALLFANPAQLELLKADPQLMPSAVEEMLRCDGPANVISRMSLEPVEIGGHEFPAGQHFWLALAAGNHDPEAFPDPDRFDITRTPNRHSAFGVGAFYCLGAALARVEADECFRILLDRCPDLRPVDETLDLQTIPPFGRQIQTLHVEFSPGG